MRPARPRPAGLRRRAPGPTTSSGCGPTCAGTGVDGRRRARRPAVLADLPDPDRVFVGGGGLDVLDAALGRLRPGGVVVATYAALDRAAAAGPRLGPPGAGRRQPGRADRARTGAVRLQAENPVFVCWGPPP